MSHRRRVNLEPRPALELWALGNLCDARHIACRLRIACSRATIVRRGSSNGDQYRNGDRPRRGPRARAPSSAPLLLHMLSSDGGAGVCAPIDETGLHLRPDEGPRCSPARRRRRADLGEVHSPSGSGVSCPRRAAPSTAWSSKELATRVEDPDDRRVRRVALSPRAADARRQHHRRAPRAAWSDFAAELEPDGARRASSRPSSCSSMRAPSSSRSTARHGRGVSAMTRYGHLITDENRKWWTLGAMCFALFMVMLDNTVVNVALPSIQRDLDAVDLRPRVDRQRLHAVLRRAARDRRAASATSSAAARMFLFGVIIFALDLGDRRVRAEHLDAGRQPRRPGRRRRVHDARDALDHHRRLPRRRARQGDRHLGRRLRPRPVDRPRRRRLPDRARLLARDLLHQPARSPSCAVVAALFAVTRVARPTVGRRIDYLGVVDADRRPHRPRARPDRGQRLGLGFTRDPRPVRRRRPGAGRVRADRDRGSRAPMVEFGLFKTPQLHRLEPGRFHHHLRDDGRRSSSSPSTCRTSSATRRSRPASASCRRR